MWVQKAALFLPANGRKAWQKGTWGKLQPKALQRSGEKSSFTVNTEKSLFRAGSDDRVSLYQLHMTLCHVAGLLEKKIPSSKNDEIQDISAPRSPRHFL